MARLIGSETPRIWTPPLRELTPETSLGFAAIAFAEEVIGMPLFPWQRWLLIHALELREDADEFRFRKVVLLVARQNGKSTLCQVLSLFFMYALGSELVLGTAQDLDTAEEVWEGALDIIEETPELAALANKPVKTNGKKSIRLKTGERYKVKAANRKAGRGLTGDLILLDELREHHSWDAWAAITGTTNARDNAQIWALSNAGDVASVVLRQLRMMAHKGLGDPDGINAALALAGPSKVDVVEEEAIEDLLEDDDETLGIFEWSARSGVDVLDRDAWCQANPSLGHGGISERTLRSAASTDPEWVFRTEVLCQWSEGTLDSVFPPGAWDKGIDEQSFIPDKEELFVCVDVSWNRSVSHIVIAGRRGDGRTHVEVIASRAGTDWVLPWLSDPGRPKWAGIAVQGTGAPVSSLLEKLQADGLPVVAWSGSEIGKAHGDFFDLVVKDQLRHRSQPLLDVAAATAVTRPIGDGVWAFDRRRSPRDCSPLLAAVGAVWLMRPQVDESKKPMIHAWPEDLVREMESWR